MGLFSILPSKNEKGIWILAMITLVLVLIIFLNQYFGPGSQPVFGFLKKKTAEPPAA